MEDYSKKLAEAPSLKKMQIDGQDAEVVETGVFLADLVPRIQALEETLATLSADETAKDRRVRQRAATAELINIHGLQLVIYEASNFLLGVRSGIPRLQNLLNDFFSQGAIEDNYESELISALEGLIGGFLYDFKLQLTLFCQDCDIVSRKTTTDFFPEIIDVTMQGIALAESIQAWIKLFGANRVTLLKKQLCNFYCKLVASVILIFEKIDKALGKKAEKVFSLENLCKEILEIEGKIYRDALDGWDCQELEEQRQQNYGLVLGNVRKLLDISRKSCDLLQQVEDLRTEVKKEESEATVAKTPDKELKTKLLSVWCPTFADLILEVEERSVKPVVSKDLFAVMGVTPGSKGVKKNQNTLEERANRSKKKNSKRKKKKARHTRSEFWHSETTQTESSPVAENEEVKKRAAAEPPVEQKTKLTSEAVAKEPEVKLTYAQALMKKR